MAPVCISIVRSKKVQVEESIPEPPTILSAEVPDTIELEFPTYEPPVEKKMDTADRKAILKMILYKYPQEGYMHPEDAADYFENFNKGESKYQGFFGGGLPGSV